MSVMSGLSERSGGGSEERVEGRNAGSGRVEGGTASQAIPEPLERMLAMWNERDLSKVRPVIDAIFTEDVVFIDPANSIVGRDAFEVMVKAFRRRLPDAVCSHASGFDAHHGLHRYHWAIHTGSHRGADLMLEGVDVTQIDPDGRISRVEGFFEPLAAPDASGR